MSAGELLLEPANAFPYFFNLFSSSLALYSVQDLVESFLKMSGEVFMHRHFLKCFFFTSNVKKRVLNTWLFYHHQLNGTFAFIGDHHRLVILLYRHVILELATGHAPVSYTHLRAHETRHD